MNQSQDSSSDLADAVAAGVLFYERPDYLRQEQVDPLIWPAVVSINRCGWLWTAESCQGHPDSDRMDSWAANTKPMLRFVCRRRDLGRALALLYEAALSVGQDHESYSFYPTPEIFPYDGRFDHREWAEFLVYIQAANVFQRKLGLRVFERIGAMACADVTIWTDAVPPLSAEGAPDAR